jgi:hypothetical protein
VDDIAHNSPKRYLDMARILFHTISGLRFGTPLFPVGKSGYNPYSIHSIHSIHSIKEYYTLFYNVTNYVVYQILCKRLLTMVTLAYSYFVKRLVTICSSYSTAESLYLTSVKTDYVDPTIQ